MTASTLSFRAAVLLVLAGMTWGMAMAASGNHATAPAHAHLNLLGWVSLFLFGIYYRMHPAVDRSRLARIQVWVWILAVLVQAVGVGLVTSGRESAEPIAALSSLVVIVAMGLFAYLVFRHDVPASTGASPMPAE
jgi:peptidoglycan/LPS O-acetylase OafA/YrhL